MNHKDDLERAWKMLQVQQPRKAPATSRDAVSNLHPV